MGQASARRPTCGATSASRRRPAHLPADPAALARLPDLLPVAELLMYASDHPHDHGGGIDPLLALLDDAGRAAILGGNAARLYGLQA